jgi:D-sedoheptulose 7-phosphate isomerase
MIKIVLFDIDGVITDGRITVDEDGRESKHVSLRDIDAVYEIKRQGYKIGAITGEKTRITEYFERRFPWDYFYRGCKSKVDAIKDIERSEGVRGDEICYVGDAKYDIEAMEYAGFSVSPCDAIAPGRERAEVVLGASGRGALWALAEHLRSSGASENDRFFEKVYFEHLDMFRGILADRNLRKKRMDLSILLTGALRKGSQMLIFGNGGSASDAQHIACELVSRVYRERRAINAEALTTNTSSLTAISNDYVFDRVFARQVEAKCAAGDVLLGISTGGTSKNVLTALELGKKLSAHTALLTGQNVRGYDFVDSEINVPSGITPRIQEGHIFIGHLICERIEKEFYESEVFDEGGRGVCL